MADRAIYRERLMPPAWLVLPSWLLSVLFHGSLATVILVFSQLYQPPADMSGDEGEAFQEVGIHLRPSTPVDSPEQVTDSTSPPPVSLNPLEAPPVTALANSPPIDIPLPQMELPPIVGAGSLPTPAPPNVNSLITPSLPSSLAGVGSAQPVAGGTSFLGINDVGQKFVYVIDRSFSMENDNALQAAKSELLASLQRLDSTQQFQVIFYHDKLISLETRDGDYFWGTDAQRLRVSEQIRAVYPKGGTRHMPAISLALSLKPDVIFLLTDGAAESALSRKDFETIQLMNRGKTRIHCIEFGRAAKPLQGDANFLVQLSNQNSGKYSYRNVTRSR